MTAWNRTPVASGPNNDQIAAEVIAHMTCLYSGKIRVVLGIEAELPDGAPDQVVRTVTESSRTLEFGSCGVERELATRRLDNLGFASPAK